MTDYDHGRSGKIGRAYENHVCAEIEALGFRVIDTNYRHPSGVQFDIYAVDPFGNEVAIECKGGTDDSTAPGMARLDNIWKVKGYLYDLEMYRQRNPDERIPEYFIVTSHMPKVGSNAHRDLSKLELLGRVRIVVIPMPGQITGDAA